MNIKRERASFEDWMGTVNALTRASFHMSIYELYEEIPREILTTAFQNGIAPRQFVDVTVTPVLFPEEFENNL